MGQAEDVTAEVFAVLRAQGDANYIGEEISQLEHSLQAASFAEGSGADEETILAALLHDIGQFLPLSDAEDMLDESGQSVGKAGHDKLGEAYLRQKGFSNKVASLVGSHVIAKRYLTGSNKAYYDTLSTASKSSLKFQGGPFTPAQVAEFEQDPIWRQKVALRQWDDRAKIVDWKGNGLDHYYDLCVRVYQLGASQ